MRLNDLGRFCFLLLLLVSYRLWRHTKKMKLDQDEESMRVSTQQLRQILQITLEHGYSLSTESRAVWHRFGKYVIIPKVQMEAAVRLWRREDFDIDAFDAFCVLIADNDYHAHANDSTDGVDSVEKGDRVNGSTGFVRPVPLQGKGPPFGSSAADLEVGATSGRAQGTQVDGDGRAPDQLQLLRQWVLEQASGAFAEVSIGKIMQTAVMGQRTLSRPQLYRYLCHKVMHLRIFRDSSCSLFNELKVHVRVVEGGKERIQVFQGDVIARQGGGLHETYTVRKLSYGVGVERTFPVHTPSVAKIEVVKRGDVRRAKLYYLRDRVGKSARIREKRDF